MKLDEFKASAVEYGAFMVNKTGEYMDAYFASRDKANVFHAHCLIDAVSSPFEYVMADAWTVRLQF